MKTRDLIAGLAVMPIPDQRDRYTHGTVVVNEDWAAVVKCCEPGCRWRASHKSSGSTDLGIRAKNHAEMHGHQTLLVWYAADRYLPDPDMSPEGDPQPGTAPRGDPQPRGRGDARPDSTNSRNTTARRTK